MPRGIVPVVALLIIASAFSQFGGSPAPALLDAALQSSSPAASAPAGRIDAEKHPNAPSLKSDLCKDLTPCIPRADLGPWTASCRFVRAQHVHEGRSPMVAVDLGRPVAGKLPSIANHPEILDPVQVKDASPSDDDSLGRWCLKSLTLPITTLIVTLPDPVNSHLSLDFDRRIDALQSAALDAQYVLDQFWLPWDGSAPGPDDADKTGKDRVLRRLRQNQPGLQIFRSRDFEHPKALFVFMVGETPTQGVNLSEFENAITYVREVQTAARQSTTSEIKILGPGFSGSIPVLSEVLKHQINGNACCFEIIPSSATDHDLLRNLSESVQGAGTVHSVLHDDDAALERFLLYARDALKIRATDVAILSESQTAFGSTEFVIDATKAATSAKAPSARQCWYDNPDSNNSLRDCTLRLNFPREIYRLRSAYPDAPRLGPGSSRTDNPPASGLTFNLKTFAGRENDLPSFSREQLPLSQEAVMLSLAETIHRRKIRMVGVEASDVFDSLFVMRFLQEYAPDVRLFVLDSDLLFVRAADNLSLQGTLAVTNYPLSSILQSWQGGKRVIRSFSNRNAEVTYNAFLALIGENRGMRDYTWLPPEITKCASPGEPATAEPLLWLTVVSRNGFQPVHILDCKANEDSPLPFVWAGTAPGQVPSDRPSGGYLLLCGLLLAVTLTQLALTFFGRCDRAPFLGWMLEYFHISDNSAVKTQKAYLLANSFIVLAVLDFIVFLPVWRVTYLTPYDGFISIWYLGLWALSMAAVIGNILAAMALSAKHKIFSKSEGQWLAISWAIALIYYLVWFGFTMRHGYDSAFFLQRSLDLANGASPLLPHLLLFVAIYLWSITNLRRVHLWETRRQSLSFTSLDDQYRSHFSDLEENLDIGFRDMFFSKRSWIILLIVVSTLLALRPFSFISSFEPFAVRYVNVFDLLYVSYLLLCTAFLTHSLLRFVACWAGLQKILRRLERQPIRHAFDRLPKKTFSWTPIWHAGGARRSYVLQTRALECLRKLNARAGTHPLPDSLKAALPDWVTNLERRTAKLLDAEAAGFLDLEPENEACQLEDVKTIADSIARDFLIPHWLSTGATESFEPGDKKDSGRSDSGVRYLRCDTPPQSDDCVLIAEEFVALRFVAFTRYAGVQLRNLLSFFMAGFILCVISLRSYPFLAQRTIGWALTIIFIAFSIPIVISFAQMDKDAILSRLSDTEPGKLDRGFYIRLISYGALPLLTVLASQFPAIGRFLFSWVQPAIEAMH